MKKICRALRYARPLLAGAAFLATSTAAQAASDVYLVPDVSNPGSVTFKGQTFVNQGLVGAGRLAADSLDFLGQTLGSFSGMAVDANTWRRNGNTYTGSIFTLPDRGYNNGSTFSDYAARLHSFDITFTPYTGSANLPQAPASQNQLVIKPTGGFVFTDFTGKTTTGANPAASTIVENGFTLPSPATGLLGAGKVSIDAEAVSFLNDGSFYVGDEYTGGVYYFDASGHMAGYLEPETALLPRAGSPLAINFGADLNTVGRRTNQGMEGVSVTPDGKRLFAVLQSATLQDSNNSQQNRNNTRVLVYDISTNRAPANPIGHYVLQLPIFDRDGTGPDPDRTAAQSEILALNSDQFLLLTRDGNGLGVEDNRPLMFKSIYLVDINGATNLAGTASETSNSSIVTGFTAGGGGTLNPAIIPVQTKPLVNLISPTQLNKLGFTTAVTPTNPTGATVRISEKWESMALLPVLEESAPQDFFLLVGNDNDFATPTGCVMPGVANCNGPLRNDSVILVWRLTLPTYVDPVYLQAMLDTAPVTIGMIDQAMRDQASSNGNNIQAHLDAARHTGYAMADAVEGDAASGDDGSGFSLWAQGSWATLNNNELYDSDPGSATLGAEYVTGRLRLGVAGGWHTGDVDTDSGFGFKYHGWQFSAYAAYTGPNIFANFSYTYGDLSLRDIEHPAGYGLTGFGETNGHSSNFRVDGGYMFNLGPVRLGPVAGAEYVSARADAFIETGAAGGNISFPRSTVSGWSGFGGAELSVEVFANTVASLRATYNAVDADKVRTAVVRLASVQHALGTQTINIHDFSQNFFLGGVSLSGTVGKVGWNVGYNARIGTDNGVEHRFMLGASLSFN